MSAPPSRAWLLGLPILPLSCLPLWGLRCACPCNNSIAYYAIQCNSIGQIFLNYFALNEPRPGAPPAVRALEQALSWTICFARALEPVVSPGYPAGVGHKTAGQALPPLCPLFSLGGGTAGRFTIQSRTFRSSRDLGRFLGFGLRFRHRSNRKPTLGSPRKPQCRPRLLCWCSLCCS